MSIQAIAEHKSIQFPSHWSINRSAQLAFSVILLFSVATRVSAKTPQSPNHKLVTFLEITVALAGFSTWRPALVRRISAIILVAFLAYLITALRSPSGCGWSCCR